MRTADATWVQYVDGGQEHYCLDRDPDQLVNDAARLTAAERAVLGHQLSRLMACTDGPTCRAADSLAA